MTCAARSWIWGLPLLLVPVVLSFAWPNRNVVVLSLLVVLLLVPLTTWSVAGLRRRWVRRAPKFFLVLVSVLVFAFGWGNFTVGVTHLRALNYMLPKETRPIVDLRSVHFAGRENLGRTENGIIIRDDARHIALPEVGASLAPVYMRILCPESIQSLIENRYLHRDTTDIANPWQGRKVFCAEFLGDQSLFRNIDWVNVYANAIYGRGATASGRRVGFLYVGDSLFTFVDTTHSRVMPPKAVNP